MSQPVQKLLWGAFVVFACVACADVGGVVVSENGIGLGNCDGFKVESSGAGCHVLLYDTPDKTPIVYCAELMAKDACAKDCCLWLDVHYVDGSTTWGTGKAVKNCPQGTHGWIKTIGVFRPKKPVRKIEFYTLFRGAKKRGEVKFRNKCLYRREPKPEEETSDIFWDDYPYTGKPRVVPGLNNKQSCIWVVDSMEKVTPQTFPPENASRSISLELAANERESAQICITAGRDDGWKEGWLEITSLRRKNDGKEFSGKVIWQRVGYIPRRPGGELHIHSPNPYERWIPDPLLPAGLFKVRPGSTQGLWLTAYASPDAEPGIYNGEVRILRDGRVNSTVKVWLTVRNFALPNRFGINVSLSVMDGFTRLQYPDDFRSKRRESWDIMLDHRLSPDDISRFTLPDLDELEYAKSRGMNLFNILNIVPEPKDPNTPIVYTTTKEVLFSDWFYPSFRDRVVPYVKELRRRGLADMAYIYGFDEQQKEYYPAIEMFWNRLRKDVPGIPLMSTSKAYRDIAANPTNPPPGAFAGDWMCPLVSAWNQAATDELRRRGKKIWWYTCLSPSEPYPNFANLEAPFYEGRILGWATHQIGAEGFLFWVVNYWKKGVVKLDESMTFFPQWKSEIGNKVHGDGILLYPGCNSIFSSIRLANVRDGIEDAEWLKMAQMLAGKDSVSRLCQRVVRTSTDFTRDPQKLRAVRSAVGDLIEGSKNFCSKETKKGQK